MRRNLLEKLTSEPNSMTFGEKMLRARVELSLVSNSLPTVEKAFSEERLQEARAKSEASTDVVLREHYETVAYRHLRFLGDTHGPVEKVAYLLEEAPRLSHSQKQLTALAWACRQIMEGRLSQKEIGKIMNLLADVPNGLTQIAIAIMQSENRQHP